MANKQTRQLKKLGCCTHNGGASCTVTAINHGSYSYLPPDSAKRKLKERNSPSWKTRGIHPSNVTVRSR